MAYTGTFTYEPGTAIGRVRFLVQDTISASGTMKFWDEEIEDAISLCSTTNKASAYLLYALAANQSKLAVIYGQGTTKIDISKKAAELRATADALLKAEGKIAAPYSGRVPVVQEYDEYGDLEDWE